MTTLIVKDALGQIRTVYRVMININIYDGRETHFETVETTKAEARRILRKLDPRAEVQGYIRENVMHLF